MSNTVKKMSAKDTNNKKIKTDIEKMMGTLDKNLLLKLLDALIEEQNSK